MQKIKKHYIIINMLILIAFAFIAGIVTILSPCILPILPIVLSGSVSGGKKKPLGIILGFIISFTFFTLFLTTLVKLTGIPSETLRYIAAVVLLIFGITLLVPSFQTLSERLFQKLSFLTPKAAPNTGFFGGFVIGLSIGLIWTPCVGPILASVIALAATSTVTTTTFLITLFYSLGSAIPMFFIMIGGRNLLNKVPLLTKNGGFIQKAFGIIMIILSIVIFLNYDRQFEAFIATTPYGADLTKLEQNDVVTNELNKLHDNSNQPSLTNDLLNANTLAPDFVGIDKWLNTDKPIHISDLKGKVVLVDFWTYSCINCIRTLPHVTNWYDKYHNEGFTVIGVHTPEFDFEKNTQNVKNAIKQYNIHYPVAQDNEYKTWNNYNNEYWPAEYLIDANGNIKRVEFGEGEYDKMEEAIQLLLKQNGKKITSGLSNLKDQTPTTSISPESYLGQNRMLYEVPDGKTALGNQNFDLQSDIPLNHFSFGGEWNIESEFAVSGKNAQLSYHFLAGKVFLVANPGENQTGLVKVLLDGKPISKDLSGNDVINGILKIDSDRLYDLINLNGKTEEHILTLEFETQGTKAFTFTFGS